MTNYTSFPLHRCGIGFTIKFNDHQFSWSDDTVNQRKYLATSKYIDAAESVYVGKLNIWLDKEEFRSFCIEENYKKAMNEYKTENKNREIRNCPQCDGKLKLIYGRFGPFMGCSNYPDCNFTEKVKIEY